MSYWISFDPGLRNCGIAIWEGDTLVDAGTTHTTAVEKADGWRAMSREVCAWFYANGYSLPPEKVVYEMPQILANWRKGDPNTVLEVAGALGASIVLFAGDSELIPILPSQWTRQKKKNANAQRVLRKITESERKVLEGLTGLSGEALTQAARYGDLPYGEHAFDAVGVGLYHLRRWKI